MPAYIKILFTHKCINETDSKCEPRSAFVLDQHTKAEIKDKYQTQEALDREDRYLIELLFECEHEDEPDEPDDPGTDEPDDPGTDDPGTDIPYPDLPEDPWTAITITVNGWNLVEKPVEL